MHSPASTPNLRLVTDRESFALRLLRDARAENDFSVAAENRRASALRADDARRVFALEVAGSLDAGKAAILTTDKRRRLLSRSRALGLRAFDANLIIAIVQDDARRGIHGIANQTASDLLHLVAPPSTAPFAHASATPFAHTSADSTNHPRQRAILSARACITIATLASAIATGAVLALIQWITR